MKIFEKEIEAELVIMEQQTVAAQENEIKLRFQQEQYSLNAEIERLLAEVQLKTQQRDELDRIAREEADGTGGSKQRNAGPIYKLKRADAEKADLELHELMQKNDQLISEKRLALAALDQNLKGNIANLAHQKIDGPASRMEALNRITTTSSAIWWANWFIILLFIAVETAPVFVKLISPQGPYDHLLRMEEHAYEGQLIEYLANSHAAFKSRAKDLPATESDYLTGKLDVLLDKS